MVEEIIIGAFLSLVFTGFSLWFSKKEKERAVQAGILVVNGVAYKVERLNKLVSFSDLLMPVSQGNLLTPSMSAVKEQEKRLKSEKHCGGCE